MYSEEQNCRVLEVYEETKSVTRTIALFRYHPGHGIRFQEIKQYKLYYIITNFMSRARTFTSNITIEVINGWLKTELFTALM